MEYNWQYCEVEFILYNYADNMLIQYKLPNTDIWLDYDTKTARVNSLIVFIMLRAKWRFRIL
jgi:hypothetical protein